MVDNIAKKAIILAHPGGELGSQLWNFASVYAYCLERKMACENYSFFEYFEFFPNLVPKNLFIKTIFFLPFSKYRGRKFDRIPKFFRLLYKVYVSLMKLIFKERILLSDETNREGVFILPPSSEAREINVLEKKKIFAFDKRTFRNPVGMEKYRREIISFFSPNKKIQLNVQRKLTDLRSKYENVIGVHIRQGEYRSYKRGKFFVDQGHMRTFIDEFIEKFRIDRKKTCFYITSDSKIENKFFEGLCYVLGEGDPATELFMLSGTDIIIGSDSNFGSFASYYGNIPHIVCHRSDIDWDYYKDKSSFFQNKYWKVARY